MSVGASAPLSIAGSAGTLEALLNDAPDSGVAGFAVVCHPHPLYGGNLHNKVAYTLARALQEYGLPTLRFNYRGVGASAGRYDQGRGETEDALAVIAYGRTRWAGSPVTLAGFSFGAMIALAASARVVPKRLICVAPPVDQAQFASVPTPACPFLIVQGDADEIVDPRAVQEFARRATPPAQLIMLPGVSHFFHGRLRELHDAVIAFLAQTDSQ